MSNQELYETVGGAISYTSSGFINAISRLLSTVLSIGQVVGTVIRKSIKSK